MHSVWLRLSVGCVLVSPCIYPMLIANILRTRAHTHTHTYTHTHTGPVCLPPGIPLSLVLGAERLSGTRLVERDQQGWVVKQGLGESGMWNLTGEGCGLESVCMLKYIIKYLIGSRSGQACIQGVG